MKEGYKKSLYKHRLKNMRSWDLRESGGLRAELLCSSSSFLLTALRLIFLVIVNAGLLNHLNVVTQCLARDCRCC